MSECCLYQKKENAAKKYKNKELSAAGDKDFRKKCVFCSSRIKKRQNGDFLYETGRFTGIYENT